MAVSDSTPIFNQWQKSGVVVRSRQGIPFLESLVLSQRTSRRPAQRTHYVQRPLQLVPQSSS